MWSRFSIESAGEETWQKVTRGQQRQTGHDPLRQGSCDLVVMQSMDIVQMLKQQPRPLFGGQTWEAAPDRPALIEVTFCFALIWLKVYQLERFLTLVLCMGGVAIEVVLSRCDHQWSAPHLRVGRRIAALPKKWPSADACGNAEVPHSAHANGTSR